MLVLVIHQPWFAPTGGEDPDELAEMLEVQQRQRETADAFLAGRVTFEEMRGFWPHQTDDRTGVTDYLNEVDKYVVSQTIDDPDWSGTTVLRGDPATEIVDLKDRDGGDIVITGSIQLVNALHPTGLVDEYRLFVYPVAMGTGRRLFAEPGDLPALDLTETHRFRSGIVLLSYRTR